VNWTGFFASMLTNGLTSGTSTPINEVIVRQPDYLTAADALIKSTPIQTWKEYFTFALLNAYADELPDAFVNARFNFAGRVVAGREQLRARWQRGVTEVQGALGEALGKLYVEKHFPPAAKARADALVKNILAAFKSGIDELDWMTPATKAQAQAK